MMNRYCAPRVELSLRLKGITPTEMARIHELADQSVTEIRECGIRTFEPGNPMKFVEVTKSQMETDKTYTVQLSVTTSLEGFVYEEGMSQYGQCRKYSIVIPSSRWLQEIFGALGILPEKEVVEDKAEPKQ